MGPTMSYGPIRDPGVRGMCGWRDYTFIATDATGLALSLGPTEAEANPLAGGNGHHLSRGRDVTAHQSDEPLKVAKRFPGRAERVDDDGGDPGVEAFRLEQGAG